MILRSLALLLPFLVLFVLVPDLVIEDRNGDRTTVTSGTRVEVIEKLDNGFRQNSISDGAMRTTRTEAAE